MVEEEADINEEEFVDGEVDVVEMAVTEEGLFYLVKMEGEDEDIWVPRKAIIERHPKKLLKFYESKIITID